MKVQRKFYVCAPALHNMNNDWAKASEKEAVEHAVDLLRQHPEHKFEIIVKMIKVVRRKGIPVVTETIT
jgi:hypothetical protein